MLDIRAGVITAVILSALGVVLSAWAGVRAIQGGQRLTFFRLRQKRVAAGWRLFGLAVLLVFLTIFLVLRGEPIAYQYYPPTPTRSKTPTATPIPSITLTPTITETPTITLTSEFTNTPSPTSTPYLPLAIEVLFVSTITPDPEAVFSPLEFSTAMEGNVAVKPSTYFRNPLSGMYAVFSYDNMIPGSQWSALWYRDGELVCYETKPWDGATGGWGFSDCRMPAEKWRPGNYEVQIYVGHEWKVVGRFYLEGEPPTSTPTRTPTATITLRPTLAATITATPSGTPTAAPTLTPARTPRPPITP